MAHRLPPTCDSLLYRFHWLGSRERVSGLQLREQGEIPVAGKKGLHTVGNADGSDSCIRNLLC